MSYLGTDVEEMMMLEAMRRSMQDTAAPAQPTDDLTEEERQFIEHSLQDAQNSNIVSQTQ